MQTLVLPVGGAGGIPLRQPAPAAGQVINRRPDGIRAIFPVVLAEESLSARQQIERKCQRILRTPGKCLFERLVTVEAEQVLLAVRCGRPAMTHPRGDESVGCKDSALCRAWAAYLQPVAVTTTAILPLASARVIVCAEAIGSRSSAAIAWSVEPQVSSRHLTNIPAFRPGLRLSE